MAFVFSACGAAESFLGGGGSSRETTTTTTTTVKKHDPLRSAVEILPDRLYYIALKAVPARNATRNGKALHYFQIDAELLYWNFFLDFGPLNLGQLHRFSTKLNALLALDLDEGESSTTIVFYSSVDPNKRANAKYLIAAWQMLYLDRTPEEALRGFCLRSSSSSETPKQQSHNSSSPPLMMGSSSSVITTSTVPPFHDASPGVCTYDLTVMDCLRGLAKARLYGFFDFNDFNVQEYEHFEQVENGDLNWIIKDRIMAFAGPHFRRNVSREGYCTLTPTDYIPYFRKSNVDLVVRLNKRCYDETDFKTANIRHFEQYYLDGSCPPLNILNRVLEAFETVPTTKAFAVHCKAGLGRTGTCIGAYMMKHYKFTAAEAIGWMRICRPGMVIGPQQHFLQDIEQRMWHEGNVMMLKPTQGVKFLRITESNKGSPKSVATIQQFVEEDEVTNGREGQAEGLLARRNLSRG